MTVLRPPTGHAILRDGSAPFVGYVEIPSVRADGEAVWRDACRAPPRSNGRELARAGAARVLRNSFVVAIGHVSGRPVRGQRHAVGGRASRHFRMGQGAQLARAPVTRIL